MSLILCLLLSISTLTHYADALERNHVIDCTGREHCDQLIWWKLHGPDYRVLAWRMTAACGEPVRCGDRWVTRWTHNRRQYVATARVRTESWTLYDRELADRPWMGEAQRTEWRINLGRP